MVQHFIGMSKFIFKKVFSNVAYESGSNLTEVIAVLRNSVELAFISKFKWHCITG